MREGWKIDGGARLDSRMPIVLAGGRTMAIVLEQWSGEAGRELYNIWK